MPTREKNKHLFVIFSMSIILAIATFVNLAMAASRKYREAEAPSNLWKVAEGVGVGVVSLAA